MESVAAKVLDVLRRYPELKLAILFGSFAHQGGGPESDVDVAVDFGRSLGSTEYAQIVADLARATGRAVDLVDLRRAGQPLLSQIVLKGRRLLGSTEAYAEWIKRHLFETHDFLPYLRRINRVRRMAWIAR